MLKCLLLTLVLLVASTAHAERVYFAKGDWVGPRKTLHVTPVEAGASAYWDTSSGAYTLTALNQISQLDDLSGNGKHLVQATAANQPYLSRADNQENLIRYSEDISQVSGTTYWQYTRATNISATEYKEDGNTGTHVVGQANLAAVKGTTYRIALRLKRGAGERNARVMVVWSDGKFSYAYINPALGTLTGTAGTTQAWSATPTVTASTDGYFQFEGFVASPVTSATNALNVNITTNAGTISYAGDNTSSLHLTSVVFQDSRAASTYLPTTTFPQYRGLNGNKVAVFNGAASYLTCDALAAMFVGPDAPFSAISVVHPYAVALDATVFGAGISSGNTPVTYLQQGSGTTWQFIRTDAVSKTKSFSAGVPTTNPAVISLVTPGTTISGWANSGSIAINTDIDLGALTGLDRFGVGARTRSAVGTYWNGSISAIAIFNRAVEAAKRSSMEYYARRRSRF